MNLYSIYDSESGQCLGENKTAGQIEKLFGIKQSSMRKSAARGHICKGKYRIRVTKRIPTDDEFTEAEAIRWMKDWDQITQRYREYFRWLRRQQERRENR